MKLIPPKIWHHEIQNKGERYVNDLLEKINLSSYDVALHSQNVSGGKKQSWSEIDFLVITKKAIIGIEVKGGPVRFINGFWRVYEDIACTKEHYKKKKSPLVQVSDALDTLRGKWFKKKPIYSNLPFVKVAILCENNRRKPNLPEMQNEYCLYKENIATPEIFKEYLNRAIDYFINNDFHIRQASTLSEEQIDSTSNKLRPEWDKSYVDHKSLVSNINKVQQSMTISQYKTIDMFKSLDRLIIEGGAGTGKTFLLLYAAKFELTNNNKIAIIVKPQRLLDYLKEEVKYDSNIQCYNAETLLECAKDAFDVVLIDEGQDWCNNEGIDLIEKILKGGLNNGRWRWFGDFENQFDKKSYFSEDALDYLKDCTGNRSIIPLDRNVRNTPQIVTSLEKITKARVGEADAHGIGPEVRRIDANQLELLIKNDEKIDVNQTTVLYVNKDDLNNFNYLLKLQKYGCDFSQIDEFKGMESNYIFILGLGTVSNVDVFRDLYYKSVSRSRGYCYIVEDEMAKKYYVELLNAKV